MSTQLGVPSSPRGRGGEEATGFIRGRGGGERKPRREGAGPLPGRKALLGPSTPLPGPLRCGTRGLPSPLSLWHPKFPHAAAPSPRRAARCHAAERDLGRPGPVGLPHHGGKRFWETHHRLQGRSSPPGWGAGRVLSGAARLEQDPVCPPRGFALCGNGRRPHTGWVGAGGGPSVLVLCTPKWGWCCFGRARGEGRLWVKGIWGRIWEDLGWIWGRGRPWRVVTLATEAHEGRGAAAPLLGGSDPGGFVPVSPSPRR